MRGDRTTQVSESGLPSQMPAPWAALDVVGHRILDPDDAVVRAGLVGVVARRTGGALLDPAVAYVAAPAGSDVGDLGTAYDVEAAIPFHSGRLRSLLRERGVGRVTITKRAFAGDVEQIRTQLKLDRKLPGTAVVLITRIGSDPWAFVCHLSTATVKSAS